MEIDITVSVEVDGIRSYSEAVETAIFAISSLLEEINQVELPSGQVTLINVEE